MAALADEIRTAGAERASETERQIRTADGSTDLFLSDNILDALADRLANRILSRAQRIDASENSPR